MSKKKPSDSAKPPPRKNPPAASGDTGPLSPRLQAFLAANPEVLRSPANPPAGQTPDAKNPPAASGGTRPLSPRLRSSLAANPGLLGSPANLPVRRVNLAKSYVTAIREQGTTDIFISEERKIYPNNSKVATLTKEVSISNSVARTITVESSKLKAHNAEAGITLIGFVAIQGQIQQQLSERYSVATQNSITISEKTTIQVPPASTVEHVIQWKLVSLNGIAILGESPRSSLSSSLAEVPYRVPLRLTYTEVLNDVPQIRKDSG